MAFTTVNAKRQLCERLRADGIVCHLDAFYNGACGSHATRHDRAIEEARSQGWREGWLDGTTFIARRLRIAEAEIASLRAELTAAYGTSGWVGPSRAK